MKKYSASFTVEASIIMPLITFLTVGLMLLAMYMADCQTARNMSMINSIKRAEEYYFYADEDTRFLNTENKIQDNIYRSGFRSGTLDFRELVNKNQFILGVSDSETDTNLYGIQTKLYLKSKTAFSQDDTVVVKETAVRRDNVDFIRIISVLAKGGI